MPTASKPCPECRMTFRPVRRDQVYCTKACRQRAYRDRKVTGSVTDGDGPGTGPALQGSAPASAGPGVGVTAGTLSPKRLRMYGLGAALVLVAMAATAVYLVWSFLGL